MTGKIEKKSILQCDNCKFYFEIFKEGLDRINYAKAKNWSMILFNCPHCGKRTEWHRLSKIYDDASLLQIENKPKPIEIQEDLLPKNYLNFLKNKKVSKIKLLKDKREFNLFSLEELFTHISIDKKEYLTIYQLNGYFNILKEVGCDFTPKEIELFENALSIGDENGDILFIDKREKNSRLYIFYHDGGDIEKFDNLTIKDIINH